VARRRSTKRGPYVLTFGGTRARKYASTLTQAWKDARYWVDFGQKKVCINKRLPSGRLHQIQCVSHPKRRR
jgi:hypothetical protein